MKAYMSSTSKSQVKGPSPSRMLRLFALYENLTRFVMPLCSAVPTRPNPETPVDQSNNIVDISKVGLKQFWDLRNHMQDASTLATAHYPETLDRIFVSPPTNTPLTSRINASFPTDPRCTRLLPHNLGLDQEMVRPNHHVQNLHPFPPPSPPDPFPIYRQGKHPQKVRRSPRLRVRGHAQSRPSSTGLPDHRSRRRRRTLFPHRSSPLDRRWR